MAHWDSSVREFCEASDFRVSVKIRQDKQRIVGNLPKMSFLTKII